ncbi:MAG: InlB B-repeat-containing protein [Bacteroides sp.]
MNQLNKFLSTLLLLLLVGSAFSVSAQTERSAWYREFDPSASRNRTGMGKKLTYNVAIRIPGDNEALVGKKIKTINFFLRNKSVLGEDVHVWVAKRLPSTWEEADSKESLKVANLNGGDMDRFGASNMIDFSSPYTITQEGAYVGLTFTVTSTATESGLYPIVISDRVEKSGLWLLRTSEMSQWEESYRVFCPAIEVCLEGDFPENAAKPADFGKVAAVVGSKAMVDVALLNFGSNVIENVDYTVKTAEGAKSYHADLSSLNYKSLGSTILASLPFDANTTAGVDPISLTITKVNGQPNGITQTECRGELHTFAKESAFKRGVLVEEYTSSLCLNCPQGHFVMEAMREKGNGSFVGLSLHKYVSDNADPMAFPRERYADVSFTGTPQFLVNRGERLHVDNVAAAFEKELNNPAFAKLELKAKFSTDKTKVEVDAAVTSLLGGTYSIAYILGADKLFKSNGWGQSGYGRMIYNDIVLSTSYSNKRTTAPALQLTPNVKSDATFSLFVPASEKLKEPLKEADLFVVAILTDPNGRVVNAARVPVEGATQPLNTSKVTVDAEIRDGTVTTDPSGDVREGVKVKLTAMPSANYRLKAFMAYKTSDKAFLVKVKTSGEGAPYFTMPHFPVTVSAEFERETGKKYPVAVATVTDGTIQVDKTQAEEGEVVKVTVSPNTGYRLKAGTLAIFKTEVPSESTPIVGEQFTMPAYGVTVTALFEKEPTQPQPNPQPETFAVELKQPEHGTLEIEGYTTETLKAVAKGTELTVKATPKNEGGVTYELKELKANGVDIKSTMKFTVTAATTVTALFEKKPTPPTPQQPETFAVELKQPEHGTLEIEGYTTETLKAVAKDTELTVKATPKNEGGVTYELKELKANGVDIKGTMTFTVTAATTVTALFEKESTPPTPQQPETFAVELKQPEHGTLEVEGYTKETLKAVAKDTELTVKATPKNEGGVTYELKELKANGVDIKSTMKFKVTAATTVTALFEKKQGGEGNNGGGNGGGNNKPNNPDKPNNKTPNAVEDAVLASLSVAPNPFTTQLRLMNPEGIVGRYELVNLMGAVLRSGVINGNEVIVDTETLPTGLYLMRLEAQNGAKRAIRLSK